MSKTILKAEKNRATSAAAPVADLNATVTLPTEPTFEVAAGSPQDSAAVREDEIRVLAHAKWETAGRPSGDGVVFWLEAEREIDAKRSGVTSAEE